MDRNKLEILLTAKDAASKTIGHVGDSFDGLKHAAGVATKALAAGAVVAGGAMIGLGVSSVKSAMASENAMSQLEAVLKSTGGAAGYTAGALSDMASELESVTTFSDEAIMGAQSLLATFTNIRGRVFKEAIPVILDMSQALGQDLKSSSIQLGKALNDPIAGITALSRVGVSFTDQQKKQIEAMVAAGKTAEAQRLILKELRTEFGGSAEAAGKTFAGSMERLKNQVDNVKESIGTAIITAVVPLTTKLAEFVAAIDWDAVINKAREVMGQLWTRMQEVGKAIYEVAKQVGDYLGPKFEALWNTVTQKLAPAIWDLMQTVGPTLGVGLVGAIGLALDILNGLMTFISDNTWLVTALAVAFVAVKTAMFLTGALDAFTAVMAGVRGVAAATAGAQGLGKLTTALSGFSTMVGIPISFPALILTAALLSLGALVAAAWNVKHTIDGIMNEARRKVDETSKAATEAARKVNAAPTPENKSAFSEAMKRDWMMREAQSGLTGRNAMGTPFWGGGRSLVGERGPEIVDLPRGSRVIPNHQLDSHIGGSTTTINGNIILPDVAAVDRFFDRLNRQDQLVGMGLR